MAGAWGLAMCMMVYVGSNVPLPTSAWDEARPGFHVEAVSDRDDAVRRHFSKPRVYYVGAHEGCGCGFDWEGFDGSDEADQDFAAARESRRRLAEFLAAALQHQQDLELFACWDGNQSVEPEFRGEIRPTDLLRDHTSFRENELLIVTESPS